MKNIKHPDRNKKIALILLCFLLLASCNKVDLATIETGKPYTGFLQSKECVVVFDQVSEGNIKGRAYLNEGGMIAPPISFSTDVGSNGKGYLWAGSGQKKLKLSRRTDVLKGKLRLTEGKAKFSLTLQEVSQYPFRAMYKDSLYAVFEDTGRVYASHVEGYWTSYPDTDEDFGDIYLHKVKDLLFTRPLDLDMDVYCPNERVTRCDRPLLILIHGGAFYNDDKRLAVGFREMGHHFASRGYVVASINYRMGFKPLAADVDRAGYRALQDAHAAVCYLIENAQEFGIDTTKIFAAGCSAGAITALNLAFMREKNRPVSTTAGGVVKWITLKFESLKTMTNFVNNTVSEIASLLGINDNVCQQIWDKMGLTTDLGPINALTDKHDHLFHVNAVVNMWGAVHTTDILNNSKNTSVLSFHGNDDHIVPYDYGYPFDKVISPEQLNQLPNWLHPIVKVGKKWMADDKPVNEWFFDPMCGSYAIHEKATSLGMHSELFTSRGGGHSLHKEDCKHLSPYFYDTILPNMTRFLCEEAVGRVMVRLLHDETNKQWFEITGTDNTSEYYWEVEGGAILNKKDNKVQVLFFADAPKNSVTVCGKYKNGVEFRETWCEKTI